MIIVFSVGGSLLCPKGEPDLEYIKRLSVFAKSLAGRHKIVLVAGGGMLARNYIKAGRGFGADETFLDGLGILATRMNAMVLIAALGEMAFREVITDTSKINGVVKDGKIAVLGGLKPGQTTDAVSLQAASAASADLVINLTNVDGVYDSDPATDRNAKFIGRIRARDLLKIVEKSHRAGPNTIMDETAVRIMMEKRIKTIILSGKDFVNVGKAIEGKSFRGTLIEV